MGKGKHLKNMIFILAVFVICAVLINGSCQISSMYKEVNSLQNQIADTRDDIVQLNLSITKARSIDRIRELAETKLGMVKAENIIYLTVADSYGSQTELVDLLGGVETPVQEEQDLGIFALIGSALRGLFE